MVAASRELPQHFYYFFIHGLLTLDSAEHWKKQRRTWSQRTLLPFFQEVKKKKDNRCLSELHWLMNPLDYLNHGWGINSFWTQLCFNHRPTVSTKRSGWPDKRRFAFFFFFFFLLEGLIVLDHITFYTEKLFYQQLFCTVLSPWGICMWSI